MDEGSGNPFAALFSDSPCPRSTQETNRKQSPKRFCSDTKEATSSIEPTFSTNAAQDVVARHLALERIFLVTVSTFDTEDVLVAPRAHRVRPECLFAVDGVVHGSWLETGNLSTVVFERLMATEEELLTSTIRVPDGFIDSSVHEPLVICYLFGCARRLRQTSLSPDDVADCRRVIFSNVRTALQTPDIFDQNTSKQFCDLCFEAAKSDGEDFEVGLDFFRSALADEYDSGEEGRGLSEIIEVFYHHLQSETQIMALGSPHQVVIAKSLQFFASSKEIVKIFFGLCTPKRAPTPLLFLAAASRSRVSGRAFEDSLLGRILSQSPIVRSGNDNANDFFESPSRKSQQEIDIIQSNLWVPLATLRCLVHDFFHRILRLRSPEATNALLGWIGAVVGSNSGRAQLGSQLQNVVPNDLIYASDGFFMNLTAILLMMVKPFCGVSNTKLLKIDPRYASTPKSSTNSALDGPDVPELEKETKLLPDAEASSPPDSLPVFGLTTRLFFLAHSCYNLGFSCLSKTFLQLNQDMHQLQTAYRDSIAGGGPDAVPEIKERLERHMSRYLAIKTTLLEPGVVKGSDDLIGATLKWLDQLAIAMNDDALPTTFVDVEVPLPPLDASAITPLRHVPETLVNNVVEFVLFTHRFNASAFASMGPTVEELMTFVVIFMGDKTRMKNPHLKAQLAEVLETMVPTEDGHIGALFSTSVSSELFTAHPHRRQIAPVLLRVFVSIEMTGESVDEYMIYNYRRPMYKILKHLWSLPFQNERLVELARIAVERIENTDPPLFLKFINYLCNDAVYLLDEALRMMKEIREKEREKIRGDWQSLSEADRREKENQLATLLKHSRYYNIMGKETIEVLSLLTSKIVAIFVHPIMVERIASMLNYFLFQLCGPSRKELKVTDFEKVEFDPAALVAVISQIYVNLQDDDEFCRKVTQDGRSFRPELFDRLQEVLARTGRGAMLAEVESLASKIKALGAEVEEEVSTEDAPEEFLDAMMFTLMKDPVILPSSRQVVDRPTIARHVLSSQTDPFNREPLAMEQLIPHTELKEKIQTWLREKKAEKNNYSASN